MTAMEKKDSFAARPYCAPALRVVTLKLSDSILSNLEPIDGGDDPDIDWW